MFLKPVVDFFSFAMSTLALLDSVLDRPTGEGIGMSVGGNEGKFRALISFPCLFFSNNKNGIYDGTLFYILNFFHLSKHVIIQRVICGQSDIIETIALFARIAPDKIKLASDIF